MSSARTPKAWLRPAVLGGGVFVAITWLARRATGASPRIPPPPAPPSETSPIAISDRGSRFIAQFEGFDPKLVNDDAGHCTIGFGHLIHLGPSDGNESAEFKRGITRERGLELLAQETTDAAEVVSHLVAIPLTQAQFDALVSFTFNVGQTHFATSTLLKLLNQGDYVSVPTQLSRFVFAGGRRLPGLVVRRAAEGRLFSMGDYGPGG
jgi:lysozyme